MSAPDTDDPAIASVITLFSALDERQRRIALALLGEDFCLECGRETPCQCWNDE